MFSPGRHVPDILVNVQAARVQPSPGCGQVGLLNERGWTLSAYQRTTTPLLSAVEVRSTDTSRSRCDRHLVRTQTIISSRSCRRW